MKSIFSLANQSRALLNQGKKYDALLSKLLEYRAKGGMPPHAKEIYEDLGYDYNKFKSYLQNIHDDLLKLVGDDNHIIDMRDTIYGFYIYLPNKTLHFSARLAYEPKVGDEIECDFFPAYFSRATFYIWDIMEREYFEDKVVISIQLVHYQHVEERKKREEDPLIKKFKQKHQELKKYLNG